MSNARNTSPLQPYSSMDYLYLPHLSPQVLGAEFQSSYFEDSPASPAEAWTQD